MACATTVRALELGLESATAAIAFDTQARIAQTFSEAQTLPLRLLAQQDEVAVRSNSLMRTAL